MDRSWKSALSTAGAAAACAMLATVLWDGIDPPEPSLVVQSTRTRAAKRFTLPPEPPPVPQDTEEATITTHPPLMTFAPTAFLEMPVELPMPPVAPGPLIEEPDLPSNFV